MIKYISSRQNALIKEVAKLRQNSERTKRGLFLVEGYHLFEMAKLNNMIKAVFLLKEDKSLPENIDQYIITKEILLKLTSTMCPQEIVTLCTMKEEREIKTNRVVYLDDVSDPGNVGTILRNALAFSYFDVILGNKCASVYNEKVIQASQGAIFSLNIVKGEIATLKKLQQNGYQLYATSLKDAIPIGSVNASDKHVLIMGNEARGVDENILELASEKLYIPMNNIDSLNVGVACGIAMYILTNK